MLAIALAILVSTFAGMSASAGAAFASTSTAAGAGPLASPVPSAFPKASPADPVDTITVSPAVATTEPGGEVIAVTANSTTALASMTVHLYDATTGTPMPPLKMNPPSPPPAPGQSQSAWTSSPVTTSTLPLGTYNVTVDATDAGTSITGAVAGTFAFQETPAISMNVNSEVSYDNPTPTVSGTVTTLAPGDTTAKPYAYQKVVIADSVLGHVTVTTNASGGYSFKLADPEPGEVLAVQVLPTSTVCGAITAATSLTVRTDPVALTASLNPKTITYGGKVTVSGTLSYASHGISRPLPGQSVRIYDRPGAAPPVATARTDAKGHFTATLPKEPASVHWVLKAGGGAASPYLGGASVTLPLKVSLPTVISGFQAALSQFWLVSYRGCLTLPAGVPAYMPNLSGLVIQYAPGPNGPWRTLGAVSARSSVLCGNGGRSFSGTFTARLNYAYYRAWYAGATDVAGTGYLSSVSGRVLAWKYEDRITGFSVSPRVLHGSKPTLTVSGQLQYFSGKWLNYARQTVYIILRPQGSNTWYYMDVGNTNSTGKFSFTFTFPNPVNATWSAEFFGNSAHLATVAATLYIPVTTG